MAGARTLHDDQSPTVNLLIGPDGVILDVNRSFEEVLGYKYHEVAGRHTLEFIAPAHSGKVAELLGNKPIATYVPEADVDVCAKDGSIHTLLLSFGRAIGPGKDGRMNHFVIGVDVTDRELARESLRRSERRFRTIFENVHEAIFIKDRKLAYVLANPATFRFFALKVTDVAGMNDEELFGPKVAAQLARGDEQAMAGQVFIDQYQFAVRDKVRTFEITKAPMYDTEDNFAGLCCIARDITHRKEDEAEKHRIIEQLHEAQKLESIGQLAGGIAHHFNNLLTVVQGYAELLRKDRSDDSDLVYALDQIIDASKRSADLTCQLLAYARKGKCQTAPTDVHNVIRMVADLLRPGIGEQIEIKLDLSVGSSVITGDSTQLQTALLNLGLNARDAIPAGGQILFSTREVTLDDKSCREIATDIKPGQYMQISVKDDGVGMDSETLARVFEPFFTTKSANKASGMGLAGVYACVKTHRGAVDVTSSLGSGTTVCVYLPLAESDSAAGETLSPAGKTSGHILLVEDQKAIRDLIEKVLTEDGNKVSVCSDGEQALDFYKKNHRDIDLVILDLTMPGMDGRQAFVKMKKINPRICALLASGLASNVLTEEILGLGIKDFLHKPYRIEHLLETVHRYLPEKQ